MSSRLRLEITVHKGQTIQVLAIFVYAYRVKTSKCFTLLMSPVLFVYDTETISSDEGSMDISDTF